MTLNKFISYLKKYEARYGDWEINFDIPINIPKPGIKQSGYYNQITKDLINKIICIEVR